MLESLSDLTAIILKHKETLETHFDHRKPNEGNSRACTGHNFVLGM